MRIFKSKRCSKCKKEFIPTVGTQIYCGSKTEKIGCSYKEQIKRIGIFNKTKNKKWMNEYKKKWMKKQRKLNTPYAQRQREAKRENYYKNIEKIKSKNKIWRDNNTDKILENNRKRMLLKKGVIGTHTKKEWDSIKEKFDFNCVQCNINEKQLIEKWNGTNFGKLTKDHIIPISKGGTDYISNIQPLCISCNAQKRDKL